MAIKLYPLRNVPDEEAEQMRCLLREHDIDFHETNAGLIGIGTAAIWVNDEEQFQTAQKLIGCYQSERLDTARNEYNKHKAAGTQLRFRDLFRQNPAKVSLYIFLALLLLFFTTRPFWFD